MGWVQRSVEASERKKQEQRERETAKQRATAEKDIKKASADWTAPMVVREYEGGEKGQQSLQTEASIFAEHGYEPWAQNEQGSHIHAGRLLLTGGLSVFAGKRGIRGKSKTTVTYRLVGAGASSTAPDVADQLRKLGELRDAGVLTTDEFEAKKAELLARM